MSSFLVSRVVQSLLSLALLMLLVFLATFAMGDPAASLLPQTASERDRAALRKRYGLDQPLYAQLGRFLARAARGDFGRSYYQGRPVLDLIAERAPATIELALVAMLLALIVGVPVGLYTGARPASAASRIALGASLGGLSLPTFWIGLMLMMGLGVKLGWLPTMGRGAARPGFGAAWSLFTLDGWRHVALPAATLALPNAAMFLRLARAETMETLRQPFIRAARARGVGGTRLAAIHAFRPSLIPLVNVAGVEFGQLLAFSVVTETIFQWPGLGKLLADSIFVDRPLVVAYVTLAGTAFLLINLAVDVACALLDPRVRVGVRGGLA